MKTSRRVGNGVMIGTVVGGFLGVLMDFRLIQQSFNKEVGNMKNTNLSNARIK